MRRLVVAGLIAVCGSCAEPQRPPLTPEEYARYHVTQADVDAERERIAAEHPQIDAGPPPLRTALDEPYDPNHTSPPVLPEYTPPPAPPTPAPVADTWSPPEANANYGRYPAGYDTKIRAWFADNSKDPDSLKYRRISRPRKEFMVTDWRAHEVTYGWSACAIVNAKNSFGGYIGYHPEWFFFRDGAIVLEQSALENEWVGHDHKINCDDGK